MSSDEYKVRIEADGVVYRGRHSVSQSGSRVLIDGKLVGVEVDNDGNPLASSGTEPAAPLPAARVVARTSWLARLRQRFAEGTVEKHMSIMDAPPDLKAKALDQMEQECRRMTIESEAHFNKETP